MKRNPSYTLANEILLSLDACSRERLSLTPLKTHDKKKSGLDIEEHSKVGKEYRILSYIYIILYSTNFK